MVKKKTSAGGIITLANKIISYLFKEESLQLNITLIMTYIIPVIFIIMGIISLVIIFIPKSDVMFYYDYFKEIPRCQKSFINQYLCNPVMSVYVFIAIMVIYALCLTYIAYMIYYQNLPNQEVKYMFYLQSIMLAIYIIIYVAIYNSVYKTYVNNLGASKYSFDAACQSYLNYEYIHNLSAADQDILKANTESFLNSYINIQVDRMKEYMHVSDVSNLSATLFNENNKNAQAIYIKIRNAYITYGILDTLKINVYKDHSSLTINEAFFRDPDGLIMSVNKNTNKLINDNIINNLLDPKSELHMDITSCIYDLHMLIADVKGTFDNISISPSAIYWFVMLPVNVIHVGLIILALYYT